MSYDRQSQSLVCKDCQTVEPLEHDGQVLANLDLFYLRIQEFAAKHALCKQPLYLVRGTA